MNKERIVEGGTLKATDYYNISVTRDEDIEFLTKQKNNNISIREKTEKFRITKITEIEDEFYDVTVNNESHKFIIAGGIVTHNCGGANVIDKIKCKIRIASDINPYLIALLKRVQNKEELYDEVPKELYDAVRTSFNNRDNVYADWEYGNIGFLASYNGRFFDGGYAKSGYEKLKNGGQRYRDYYRESKDNILSQNLEDIIFINDDYRNLKTTNSVIYCDPPYENQKQYANSLHFDYDEFWNYMRKWSKNNIVLISELNAPKDFECIWEKSVSRTMKSTDNTMRATEKLFTYKNRTEPNLITKQKY